MQPPIILLVDNDPNVLEMLSRLLEITTQHLSTEMVTADSGTAALAVIASRDVALVIADYRMPGMDGLELATTVKAASPATRVVIMSGEDPLDMMRRTQAVAEYVLPKPFRLGELRQIVDDCFLGARQ